MKTEITIHQTLHGYSRGHSLLASSQQLSTLEDRRLLFLSDLSGSRFMTGFETYMTGYPLKNSNLYVLARTWYADEMERPGCVWTHSLLIKFEDLNLVTHPEILLNYFRRPALKGPFDHYSSPIFINRSDFEWSDFSHSDAAVDHTFEALLASVYEAPDKQIFVSASNSRRFENTLLKVWEYQGSKLRMNFSFCSGSLENRSTAEIKFDIQCMPEQNVSRIANLKEGHVVIFPHSISSSKIPVWAKYLSEEFSEFAVKQSPKEKEKKFSHLVSFLKRCDADGFSSRSTYRNLWIIFLLSQKTKDEADKLIDQLLEITALALPEKNKGIKVKSFVLRGTTDFPHDFHRERDILINLCSRANYEPFSEIEDELSEWSENFFIKYGVEKTKDVMQSMIQLSPNRLGEEFLSNIIDHLSNDEVLKLFRNNKNLWYFALYKKPTLFREHEIWYGSTDDIRERFDVIFSSPKFKIQYLSEIIDLSISQRISAITPKLFKNFEKEAVAAFLEWLNKKKDIDTVEANWKNELQVRQEAMIEWMVSQKSKKNLNFRTILFIASLCDANSEKVWRLGAKPWLDIFEEKINLDLDQKEIRYYTFLLSIAFSSLDSYGNDLISKTFLIVHTIAAQSKIPYEIWEQIENKLPQLPIWRLWDKCEMLRRGLVQRYINGNIETRAFIEASDSEEVFDQILHTHIGNENFKFLLMNKIVPSNHLSKSQKKALNNFKHFSVPPFHL